MKLRDLFEQKLETKTAQELWDGASPKNYRNSTEYLVKQTKDGKYEAFKVVGDKRKPFGVFSSADLKKTLTPLHPNQKPDGEGFMVYVDADKIQAFQYDGDPVKLDLDGDGTDIVTLKSGDFVLRSVEGEDFVFSVESEASFKSMMTPA
jgi:hypothetical protein